MNTKHRRIMNQLNKTTIVLFLASILFGASGMNVFAISTTPSLSPSITDTQSGTQDAALMNKIDQQLDNLKERIASRVAELNLVEKRGIIGTVVDASGTQIKVTDIHNNIRFIDVDELTKFSSPSAKSNFGISDLTKGTLVGVLGNYNKDSKRILARFVDVMTFPQNVSGTIVSIDNKNYQFMITTTNNKSQLIDVETFTKTSSYTSTNGIARAGFSKIAIDKHVYIVGYPDKKTPTMLVASRIILLPDLSPSPSANNSGSPIPTASSKK